MKIKITFKHLEHTEALDQKIIEKTAKLKKFFEGNVEVQWTCSIKDGKQVADIHLIGSNFEYKATGESDSLYKTLDIAIKKIATQVEKKKSKWKSHLHHKHGDQMKKIMQTSVPEENAEEEASFGDESAA